MVCLFSSGSQHLLLCGLPQGEYNVYRKRPLAVHVQDTSAGFVVLKSHIKMHAVPQGENNVYRKWPAEFTYTEEGPKGHLPLTNALRGTQLIEAIFEHPAFARKGESSSNGPPSWMK